MPESRKNHTIDGFPDVHANTRFWMRELATAAAARVVYDVGSNDGELSLPLFTSESSEPRTVIAFEPQPAARRRLSDRAAETRRSGGDALNCAVWDPADITIVPGALGEHDGEVNLEVYSDDTFSSMFARPSEELSRYDLKAERAISVPVMRLDSLVTSRRIPPPELIKIDVEGAERSVLRGAFETLRRYAPPLLVEFSCVNAQNAGFERGELVPILRDAGYDVLGGLFREKDVQLYGPESLHDCRIWNIVAVSTARSSAVVARINRYRAVWEK